MASGSYSKITQANIDTDEIVLPAELLVSLKRTGRKAIQSIIEDSGGVVIEFPDAESHSDKVSIRGLRSNVEKAKQQLLELSNEKLLSTLSVKVRAKAEHYKFLKKNNKDIITKIKESTGARIIFPSDEDEDNELITIVGKQYAVDKAKAELESIIKKIEPSECQILEIEKNITDHRKKLVCVSDNSTLPKIHDKADNVRSATVIKAPRWLHRHIIGRKGVNIKKIQDLSNVRVEFNDVQENIDIKGSPEAVKRVQTELQNMVTELMDKLTCAELYVDPKLTKHIIGRNGTNINRLKEEDGVEVNVSDIDGRDLVRIEGNHLSVEKVKKELMEMIERRENETEKEMMIDRRYYRNIIGSKGDKIKEIKEKFKRVQILISEPGEKRDVIKIRGPKEDVDKCHEHLIKLVKDLIENSCIVEVPIFREFHKVIMGKGGGNIRKIEEDTQTKITLPDEGDIITIAGKKENVEEAKEKLQKIQNELTDIVSDETVIPPKVYDSLTEDERKLLNFITEKCEDVANKFPTDDNHIYKISIGELEDDAEKDNENLRPTCLAKVRAKPEHHKFIIGKNSSNIRKIWESTGARIIFPTDKTKDKEVILVVAGNEDAVVEARAELESTIKKIESAQQRVMDNVRDWKSSVTIECEIPRMYCGLVIGNKGCKVEAIRTEFNVQIKFPDRVEQEDQCPDDQMKVNKVEAVDTVPVCNVIQIIGPPDKAEAARQALLSLVPITVKVDVPFHVHWLIIGPEGRDVKELIKRYEVFIAFSNIDQKLDYIKITGTPACVEKAKEAILEISKNLQAEQHDKALRSFNLKIEVDAEYHPKLIGHADGALQKIISDNDVVINFPPIGDPEENIITIIGYENNVRNAHAAVIKLINELDPKCTMVSSSLSETQKKNFISPCESTNPPLREDIIVLEDTTAEERIRNFSNIPDIFADSQDDITSGGSNDETEEIEMEMRKLCQKLDVSRNATSLIRKHADVLLDALKYCEDSREHVMELYSNAIAKQEKKIQDLREQLYDQVSVNKLLEVERDQLILHRNDEREECKRIIHENVQKDYEKSNKMLEITKEIKANLKLEREANSKLAKENNESLKRFEELHSKHEALQVKFTEYEKRIEHSKSDVQKVKEKETSLNAELDGLNQKNRVSLAEENLKLAHYRKQLQDLTSTHAKTLAKLSEVNSNNTELSNNLAKRVGDIDRLKIVLQDKDNKIKKLDTDLAHASKERSELSEKIKSLKEELNTKGDKIRQVETDFETYKAQANENTVREKVHHEAQINKIKSNVHDLKAKLIEITRDINIFNETDASNKIAPRSKRGSRFQRD